jgi:hypothetical protein
MIMHRRDLQESDLRKEAPHARVRWGERGDGKSCSAT